MPNLFDIFSRNRGKKDAALARHRKYKGPGLAVSGQKICPGCPKPSAGNTTPPELPKIVLPKPGRDMSGNDTKVVSIVNMRDFSRRPGGGKKPDGLF